jgi:hypothetical protein
LLKAIDMHAHIRTGDRAKQQSGDGVPRNTGKLKTGPDDMAEMYQRLANCDMQVRTRASR